MTNFLDEIKNLYELSYNAASVEMPAKRANRMARIILDINELCKEWKEGHTEEEACAEQIIQIIHEE